MRATAPETRVAGRCLVGAAVLFWISWLLMPGVGVTDAAQILALVGPRRGAAAWSAAVQLISAVLYVPALLQGPGLLMIAPLILAFFVGGVWLSVALARAGAVTRWDPGLYALAPVVIAIGGAFASE